MPETLIKKARLSRNDWLARALEVFAQEGGTMLTIVDLCEKLGVTKGSFYAHFEDREDFLMQLVGYWADNFTKRVETAIDKLNNSTAEARLLALMELLKRKKLARYDIAVRAWAAKESFVAQQVREVDKRRFNYIRGIFHEMGFRDTDLDMRTRIFVAYHSLEAGMRLPPSRLNLDEEIRLRHRFFVRH